MNTNYECASCGGNDIRRINRWLDVWERIRFLLLGTHSGQTWPQHECRTCGERDFIAEDCIDHEVI